MTLPIGAAIRHVRQKRGLSQVKLSLNAGMPRSYVGKVENLDCIPTIETFCKLATAMQMDPDAVLRMIWKKHQSMVTPADSALRQSKPALL
jgi:transcriptional regulator with XRE-family HTH domain